MGSIIASAISGLFAKPDSISRTEVENVAKRDKFSTWLPWLKYSQKDEKYLLTDNTIAYMWEITPLVYAGRKQNAAFDSILKQSFPKGTVFQWVLFPDNDVEYILDAYKRSKKRVYADDGTIKDQLGARTIEETCQFFRDGKDGLKNNAGMPVRNFRCFISLKNEIDLAEYITTIEELLNQKGLQPQRLTDITLIDVMSKFINGRPKKVDSRDNKADFNHADKALREYVIDRDNKIDFKGQYPTIGGRKAVCLTPLETPNKANSLETNNAFGGVMGVSEDNAQLNFPFWYSLNVIYDDCYEELAQKASITMSQSGAGGWVEQVKRRVQEFQILQRDKADKKRYYKIIPALWVFGDNDEQLQKNVSRAKTVWNRPEAGGWTIEPESKLNKVMFISSMLGGLYNFRDNVKRIDRHYYVSAETAARLLPVQGDYSGNGNPTSLLLGRKSQLIGLDVFAKGSNNHNFLVCAESGAGKSFLLNTLLSDYYYQGDLVRIVDLGGSYKKLASIAEDGKFFDFDLASNNQCTNPLDFIYRDDEDVKHNLIAAATVFEEMVYSKSKKELEEHESQLIKRATKWAFESGNALKGSDAIYEYLIKYKELTEGTDHYLESMVNVAELMAFNLVDFTSSGPYGKFFVGKSTIRINKDPFVVIEMENLKADDELFGVIMLQMMNEITQDLYLSDRKNKRFILFEEAPSILKKQGHAKLDRLGVMVEEGYRRARKYGGAFGVVMQSIMDIKLMGEVGEVILGNAAYKFMLESKSGQYEIASEQGLLPFKDFALGLLSSVVNNKPKYSELFISTPQGNGIARLVVDRWRYWVNTTEAEEVAIYEEYLAKGMSTYEAIDKLYRGE